MPPSPDVLKKLDAAVRAVQAAFPEKADALARDQEAWLIQADYSASFPHDRGADFPKGVDRAYEARIAVLASMGETSGPEPLSRLREAAMSLKPGHTDVVRALADQGSLVISTERDVIPLEPDDELRRRLAALGEYRVRELQGSNLGSAFPVNGSPWFATDVPYRIDGGRALALNAPDPLAEDDVAVHYLVRVGDSVAVASVSMAPWSDVELTLYPWDGKTFGAAQSMEMRFSRVYEAASSLCGIDEVPCADFAAVAETIAARHDIAAGDENVVGYLERPDSPGYLAAYEVVYGDGNTSAYDGLLTPSVTKFAHDIPGLSGLKYDISVMPFAFEFRGEHVLGLVGDANGATPWGPSWLVTAWRVRGGKLERVAAARVNGSRGTLLRSVVVQKK